MRDKHEPESVRPDADSAEGKDSRIEGTPLQVQAVAARTPVVGIRASAGGLEAFKLLLAQLPPQTGFAVVLIQHLDPTHHSMLSEILGRSTQVPVSEAADGMAVEPNHVYVIPPNSELTIANRVLKLTPRGQTPGPHMPIDRFLSSCRNTARPELSWTQNWRCSRSGAERPGFSLCRRER